MVESISIPTTMPSINGISLERTLMEKMLVTIQVTLRPYQKMAYRLLLEYITMILLATIVGMSIYTTSCSVNNYGIKYIYRMT